ncbi:MAG: peptidoglycan DD-metalloendopeptidase family protein [Asticcacaulis sp.]
MLRSSAYLLLTGLAVCSLIGGMRSDAQARLQPLSTQQQDDLDALGVQRRAAERKSDETRQTARQLAQEIVDLHQQILDISRHQGVSETRAAIYRAKLETLNLQEVDIERQLVAARGKESRLLSALQIYSRNPPPALFVAPKKANDAVLAAIIMRAITPELQKRTDVLIQQNQQLVGLRRQSALQNEALFISQGDVSEQRSQIEALISQKSALEDQLLGQADQYQANAAELKAQEDKALGNSPLRGMLSFDDGDTSHLLPPVVGDKLRDFGQSDVVGGTAPAARGISYAAQPGAQVTAPAEGEVEFVGPLDSYGQVVIINAGGDYRVVLTGLGRVYVDKGQTVARQEPLGRMPVLTDHKVVLYMELRHGEDPVNPSSALHLAGN